jgi:hypothetical protein
VIEAGIGWGALSIKLLEAIGPSGRLISYEVREDFAESGRKTVTRFLGECPNLEIKLRDIYLGIEEKDVDRIVLDLPEPWHVVPHAREALVPGGILLSYLPSTLQVKQMADAIAGQGSFTGPEVFEVILRPWHVKGQSVRPVQWMFSHSAFIIVCRKITYAQDANREFKKFTNVPKYSVVFLQRSPSSSLLVRHSPVVHRLGGFSPDRHTHRPQALFFLLHGRGGLLRIRAGSGTVSGRNGRSGPGRSGRGGGSIVRRRRLYHDGCRYHRFGGDCDDGLGRRGAAFRHRIGGRLGGRKVPIGTVGDQDKRNRSRQRRV